jgi:tetratricopeptide (TPR) repeat protein
MSDAAHGNLELARRYLEIDRPERALELLQGGQNDLDDPEFWRLRAVALLKLERENQALGAARRGLELEPDSIDLLLVAAHAHRKLGDLAAAERSLLAALRLESEQPTLLAEYALLVARAGQLQKARALLDEAERLDPMQPYVEHARGVVAFLSADDKAARRHAEAVLATNPESEAALLLRGSALAQRRSFRGAQRSFDAAARLDPTDHGVAQIAREVRVATHPLLWPIYPIQRWGAMKVWLAFIVFVLVTTTLKIPWVDIPVVLGYLFMVAYSWLVAPFVVRRLRRRR